MNNIKRIKTNRLNTKFRKIKKPENKKSTKNIIRLIIYIILFFVITSFVLMIVLYNKYLRNESIDELKNYKIAETSILYDKNGKELYRFFKEDRTYVEFEKISKNMVNAIVSGEDKRYWENPGVDIIGLVRAGIYFVTGKSESIGGTSTLTQQLIRNTIIEKKPNESAAEGIDRKLKEIFLSYNLTKSISKEKILELYLNKIEFGHNAFGIESASKRFFNKQALNLTPFEASILASLPKGPSYYSPYNRQDRLVGYIAYKDGTLNEKKEHITTKLVSKEDVEKHGDLVNILKEKILKLKGKEIAEGSNKYMICGIEKNFLKTKYKADNDGCLALEYSEISDFISYIEIDKENRNISYYPGRKDYILGRMLEDKKITFEDYKKSIIEGIGYTFNRNKESITAPHFVFYVKEILEEKYGAENLTRLGLKIYTTIDLDVQKKAEKLVADQAAVNRKKFNAKNSALISIDNKTGGIVAMVGNEDYFSENGKGNVNVITSKLQPGSSFKPFVYSLAMQKNQIGTKTPIYDVKMTFPGKYEPKNFDGKFMGKITVSTALNYSRNIPAIKMFYMTDGSKGIIDFMHKLGAKSLEYNDKYGASLALGTGEMTPLDLAKAYTVFANMGEKVEISPINKIVDSKGNVIYESKEVKKERVMPSGQAFLINNILSDSSSRPSGWNNYLNIGRPAAVKTGTSTKPVKEGGKDVQYPANLFVAGYTPQITTIVWSGNITGETMKYSGSGLEGSAPLWREFMKYYHKGKEVQNWEKPKDVKKLTVSEISGLLPNPENPHNFLVSSYFINPPKKIDDSYKYVEYDALCNGKVTNETPITAIKKYTILNLHSLKPNNEAWEAPVRAWASSQAAIEKYGSNGGETVSVKNEVCQRSSNGGGNIEIRSNLSTNKTYGIGANPINIAFQSSSNIIKVEILINGEITQTIKINNKSSGGLSQNIFIPEAYNSQKISVEIRAINSEYFSNSEKKDIYVGLTPAEKIESNSGTIENKNNGNNKTVNENSNTKKDFNIKITNPKSSSIRINKEDYFNLRFNVSNIENFSTINILMDGNNISTLGNNGTYVIPINQSQKFDEGIHNLKIQVIGNNGEIKEENLKVEIL